ncbi:MAG: hypothetical protein UZ08_BCD001002932 [Candidatus Parvibacillus calidus]|nr:MAG: hypothetical protein UZ08_BCD001002932 [Candidatus Parvibacillus calidus]
MSRDFGWMVTNPVTAPHFSEHNMDAVHVSGYRMIWDFAEDDFKPFIRVDSFCFVRAKNGINNWQL